MMNLFKSLLLSLGFVSVLTGCLTLPDASRVRVRKDATIGLAIQHPKGLFHTHVGTTMFNNNLKAYQPDYDLKGLFERKFTQELKDRQGFKLRILSGTAEEFNKLHELSTVTIGKPWESPADKGAVWKKLQGNEELDVMIVITPVTESINVLGGCNQFGCTYWGTAYSGLFTRSFLGLDRYFAIAAVNISVLLKNDSTDLYPYVRNVDNQVFKVLEDFQDPKDFAAITDMEFKPITAELDRIADRIVQAIAKDLSTRRDPQ